MIGSLNGAAQSLLDGVGSSHLPFRLPLPQESRSRRRLALNLSLTTSARAVISSPRLHRFKPADSASAGDLTTLNSFHITSEKSEFRCSSSNRVFLLDVNPICYDGARLDLRSFARWMSLFFAQVSLRDPVIAVLDGENGNEYRKRLLPSYKAHRRKFLALGPSRFENYVSELLRNCHVPVVKVNGYEADDIIATLSDQVLEKGLRVVIASPDKDFKQLICEDVQIVMPVPELKRWSFYTLKHYVTQYDCDPNSDLSLRCILGDEADGVPGIQQFVPSFGRKTAVKLLKKHGSLENLLDTAAVRTVGKQYAQDALNKYADYLRRNYKVLSLRRDADIHLEEEWLYDRKIFDDSTAVSNFLERLSGLKQLSSRYTPSR